MQRVILIACLVSISLNYSLTFSEQCSCTDATNSAACTGLTVGCKWNTSCTPKVCADFTTETSCDAFGTCAWTNAGVCATFTKCADYKVTTSTTCTTKGTTTQRCEAKATAETDGMYLCKDATVVTPVYVTCATYTTEATCVGMESADKACAWKAGVSPAVCVALSMTKCADATSFSKAICGSTCTWVDSTKVCQNLACTDLTTATACTAVGDYKFISGTLCQWDSTKCIAATDTSKLTSATCGSNTFGTHIWDTSLSKCEECTSNSSVLGMTILIILLTA